ncbi:hypothetical protein N7509_006007 [Penicillium cosmopolitanum]|uniref:FAD-binding domain-containing protein n=1 Tax=Penicillium cosmopolitanum TaxID=1131564 RepID=A0A9X0BAN9_9EURO|nr:uncharacterized protein N7509_006007 [Penicillium cosmopolitanum]KAJ5397894.1 hypothetical protein N7509_006007 [Penicillium cosmopolitanum]
MTIVNLSNGDGSQKPPSVTTTDVLIIGTGPAGASLACFLASYGIRGIMVSSCPTNADTPRAHITNMAAMECLRDIGLDVECNRLATSGKNMMHTRWAYSMAGEEFARIHAWGHDPKRKGDYETASPCDPVDLPQTLLEPILVRYATLNGFNCRFDTTFVDFTQDQDGTTSTLQDNITGVKYKIRSKYLFGADGARSEVFRQAELPLDVRPDQGLAFNVHLKADLSSYMQYRTGCLHWLLQPDREHPLFGWACIARMVKPWDEWLFIVLPERGKELECNPTNEEWLTRMKEFIGDDSIHTEILGVSKWRINDVVAEKFSNGRVFCLGDAVHRHPPSNGLGSNTCIQDAYNLAWKVAYVLKGQASPSILETYTTERQPVGRGVVTRANQSFRHHGPVWDALGVSLPNTDDRKRALDELTHATPNGRSRRAALQSAIEETEHEYHALGTEMGQFYKSSAVYSADEQTSFFTPEVVAQDPDLVLTRSTYPGCRVPHVWLNNATPVQRISSIDLAGGGAYTIYTGIGGEAWKYAATQVGSELGIKINCYSIGFRQDYEDVYFDWARVRGVDETGCVLVRPDRFVSWRCNEVLVDKAQCVAQLQEVMLSILGYQVETR